MKSETKKKNCLSESGSSVNIKLTGERSPTKVNDCFNLVKLNIAAPEPRE